MLPIIFAFLAGITGVFVLESIFDDDIKDAIVSFALTLIFLALAIATL